MLAQESVAYRTEERDQAMFETTVTVVGNAISQPAVREVANGARVASFRVVTRARRFDKARDQWVDGDPFFATVHCWRRLAEGVSSVVNKNDPVVVTGRLRTREYEVDGRRRSSTEIDANAVGLDLARTATAPQQSMDQQSTPQVWVDGAPAEPDARRLVSPAGA